MTDMLPPPSDGRVRPAHLGRAAVVYVRQSTPDQTERNLESTDRQYALVERAVELGWARQAVEVIDEDLGVSGSAGTTRAGFTQLTTDIALGRVGIVLRRLEQLILAIVAWVVMMRYRFLVPSCCCSNS